jgi:penicillin amidase
MMAKRWSALGAAAAAVVGLFGAGYYWLLRRPLPRTRGTLRLRGLHNPVEVLRDRWGVAHIYAETIHDLLFAQGYVHAQDRLWQMDFQRRLVAGRLAEVLAADALPLDRWIRTLTMRRVAEQEAKLLAGEARTSLEAYAAGVNARIARGRLPVEFTLLRYRPEPWTVADTLSWIKMMSWMLSVNWETEILRALLIERLGPERAAELEPHDQGSAPRIVPDLADLVKSGAEALERAEAARPFAGPGAGAGLGSNNWVVAGSRTATGAPLLANDMHLPMNLPCIWYENHLVGGDLNFTGVTFAGIPGIIAGHNGRVAWGFTNGFPDVQDLYMERLRRVKDGDGSDRVQYEFQGEWHDAQVVQEEIRVKGGETVIEEVIITRHGPIINSLVEDLAGRLSSALGGGASPDATEGAAPAPGAGPPLALRWTSLEPDSMVEGVFAMARARNCLEFREALRQWTAPVQNVVYADVEGNIAYSLPGKIPIRAKGDGRLPVPGWTGEYEWTGYVPFEELPHLLNPPRGYVATANNRVVGDDFPHHLGYDHCTGHRAVRVVELLEGAEKVDMALMQRMQFDQVSAYALLISPYLGELEVEDPELGTVVDLMREWDGELAADSPAAAVQQVFVRRMIARTLQDKLGDLTLRYAGQGPTPLLAEGSGLGNRSLEWLQAALAQSSSPWFDLGNGETRDDVIRLALRDTVDYLKRELGPEMDDWAWGKLHTLTYAHVLGQVKPLDRLFNRGPFPLGGSSNTLWATGATLHDLSSALIIGPPFRFIADLGDLRNCQGLLAPGQSGQPGSPHYDDQVRAWFQAEYHPMLYAREDVVRESRAWLELLPGR